MHLTTRRKYTKIQLALETELQTVNKYYIMCDKNESKNNTTVDHLFCLRNNEIMLFLS